MSKCKWNPSNICTSAIQFFGDERIQAVINKDSRTAYVGFGSADLAWVHKLLKKGFHHCYTFYDYMGGVLRVEYLYNKIEVTFVEKKIEDYIKIVKRNNTRIIETNIKTDKILCSNWPTINPPNCVSLTKNNLGVKLKRTWTPWQLFNNLLKHTNSKEI